MTKFALGALALSLAGFPFAFAEDTVSGKWQVHQNIVGNESDQTCTFTQSGAELSGSCEGNRGKVTIAGKVDGKKIAWSYKSEYNGGPLTVSYAGTIEAGKISGTVAVAEYSVTGDFSAKQSN